MGRRRGVALHVTWLHSGSGSEGPRTVQGREVWPVSLSEHAVGFVLCLLIAPPIFYPRDEQIAGLYLRGWFSLLSDFGHETVCYPKSTEMPVT